MLEEFSIRLADKNDINNIFELSNDKTVRQNSVHSEQIVWEDHVAWFLKRIEDKTNPFYVIEDKNNNFIGQVRFDTKQEPIISISIAENFRGKHLGPAIIKACSAKCGLKTIFAYIKKSNISSVKAFEKAGYKYLQEEGGYYKYRFQSAPVYIIAEMSANHCGDMELAKKIIKAAKEAGADAVKVQTYTADTMTINCHTDEFQIKDKNSLWAGENLYSLYQKAYTPWEWQAALKKYADGIGIDFFSTPFDYSAVDFLENIDVPMYKIASFEAIDYPLIKYAASKHKPMIISVGISSLEEIQGAIDACKSVGNHDITLLKCTSAYPAQLEDMNIATIKDMIARFAPQGVKVGLSDHSLSNIPAVTAVALGACVIEKHFTLDRNLGGADAAFSLNPQEFAQLVQDVRNAEKALGHADYTVKAQNRRFARSLFVVKDIKKGEKLTAENIRSIRPSNGLHPKYYEVVLGKTATQDLPFGKPLFREDIKELYEE